MLRTIQLILSCTRNVQIRSTIRVCQLKTIGRIQYLGTIHTRTVTNTKASLGDVTKTESQSFTPIYRFNYIVHLKVLARLKIYQTLLTIAFVPPSFYYHSIDGISSGQLATSLGIASLAGTMLYVISFAIRKVVGMISLSKEGNTVKISHLTFWGKRNDVFCDVNDVVPLADMSENKSDIFVRLKRYSSKDSFHFFLRHGQILDESKLEDIIGSLK